MLRVRQWVFLAVMVVSTSAMGQYETYTDTCCVYFHTTVGSLKTVAYLGLFGVNGYIDQCDPQRVCRTPPPAYP